jgi:hypothetical protein
MAGGDGWVDRCCDDMLVSSSWPGQRETPASGWPVQRRTRELVEFCRRTRAFKIENEILKRASAYFARENVSQNDLYLHRLAMLGPAGREGVSLD